MSTYRTTDDWRLTPAERRRLARRRAWQRLLDAAPWTLVRLGRPVPVLWGQAEPTTGRDPFGAPHSERCNSTACPCYREGRTR